jgi:hypothetical protein
VFRRSDGTQTTKRGFLSETAARDERWRLVEQIGRGEVRHTKETFERYWARRNERRRPHLEPNTWRACDVDGRHRLLPILGPMRLGRIGVDDLRGLVGELADQGPSRHLECRRPPSA